MKMQKKKVILTLAVASALGLGGQALANQLPPSEPDVTKISDSGNDNSNQGNLNFKADVDVAKDSNNDYTDNITVSKAEDSNNTLAVDASKDIDVTKNEDSNNTLAVDASKNIEVSKEVEVTKNEDSNNKLEVDASKNIEVNKEVEVTKTEDSNNKLEVDASKNIEVNKEVEVTKTEDSNNKLEVDASKDIDISKEVEINKTEDSNNTKEVEINKSVEVKKEVEIEKTEATADGRANASATDDSTSEVTDNSKNLEIGEIEVKIDKSSKEVEVEKQEVKAEEGSVAALGNASKEETDGRIDNVKGGSLAASTGSTATMSNSNNTDNSINTEEGAIAANSGPVDVTQESYNNEAEDHSAAIYGTGDATVNDNVGNTTNSNNTANSFTVGEVDVEVAVSVLEGQVSNNAVTTADVPARTGDNTMRGSLTTPSGIAVVSQNTGFDALVQQSVNVQVNR